MTTFEAPLMSLRPSSPKVQAAREEAIAKGKEHRARARLLKATRKAVPASAATARPADYAGFARWYTQFTGSGIMDGLAEAEEQKVRAAAWAAYHGGLAEQQVWSTTLSALNARHREIGELMQQRVRSRKRSYTWTDAGSLPHNW